MRANRAAMARDGEVRMRRSLMRKRPQSNCYSPNYYAAYSYSRDLSKLALGTILLYNGQVLSHPHVWWRWHWTAMLTIRAPPRPF